MEACLSIWLEVTFFRVCVSSKIDDIRVALKALRSEEVFIFSNKFMVQMEMRNYSIFFMHSKPWLGDSLLLINLHNIHCHWLPRCHEITYLSVDLKQIVTFCKYPTYDNIELFFKKNIYSIHEIWIELCFQVKMTLASH